MGTCPLTKREEEELRRVSVEWWDHAVLFQKVAGAGDSPISDNNNKPIPGGLLSSDDVIKTNLSYPVLR